MRIGVNALYLIPGGVGGTEIYLRSLLQALAAIDKDNRYFVFANRETEAELAPAQENFEFVRQPVAARFRPARIAWEQSGLILAAMKRRIDVLFNPGFTMPVACPCPSVTVIHDLQHKRHPEFFRWFDLPFWRLLVWASVRRSRLLVAVSEATREDLLRYYRIPPQRIKVIAHGVEERFFQIGRRLRAPEPYLLAVATLHPHKNLDRLVRVFAEFRRRHSHFRLVIAGLRGFATATVERQIAALGLAGAVTLTGWVCREELAGLYERAWAYVNPSLFEGFGMPLLEALAAGVPAACSAIEPLVSIAGEAALTFDAKSDEAMLAAMERIACDETLRQRLTEAGRRRAAEFSWLQAARQTLAALREAAAVHQNLS